MCRGSGIKPHGTGKRFYVIYRGGGKYFNLYYINEEVLLRVNEQRNILHEIRKRKANWIGHILRRNCLLKQVIEGKIKGGDGSGKKTRKKT